MTVARAALAEAPPSRLRARWLPWAPALTLTLLAGPVLAGLAGTLAPAFGWAPGRAMQPGLAAWRDLLAWPGLEASVRLSVTTGFLSTLLSLALAMLICAAWQGTRWFTLIERALSPLLSVPHAAAAFGLAFLIAPSGWIARALSPWATGWETPPDLLITQDPWGLAMTAGLVLKETPFLLLMTLAALAQADAQRARLAAQCMGYGRAAAWIKVVAPRVYRQIRLPVYAVLAYSMATVDVAMVLGPTLPRPLAPQVALWSADPDLGMRAVAAAGAVLQLALALAALGLWRLGEVGLARLGGRFSEAGWRGRSCDGSARAMALGGAALLALAAGMGLAGLAVWSVAGFWRFPDLLPQSVGLAVWAREWGGLGAVATETAIIGAAATLVALTLALACLEAEHRHGVRPTTRALWLLYLPLITPQVAFLFGLQTLAAGAGLDGSRATVIAAHVVFVTPYVFLSLADPFRAWDARLGVAAQTLGAGPDRVLWAVRLPMLLRPVLTAAAVGFAVSVGQYLPTLLIGGGRVATLTTEAVALASGGDRRVIGVYGLAQMVAPFAGFAFALAIPALVYRNRRGLGRGS